MSIMMSGICNLGVGGVSFFILFFFFFCKGAGAGIMSGMGYTHNGSFVFFC